MQSSWAGTPGKAFQQNFGPSEIASTSYSLGVQASTWAQHALMAAWKLQSAEYTRNHTRFIARSSSAVHLYTQKGSRYLHHLLDSSTASCSRVSYLPLLRNVMYSCPTFWAVRKAQMAGRWLRTTPCRNGLDLMSPKGCRKRTVSNTSSRCGFANRSFNLAVVCAWDF